MPRIPAPSSIYPFSSVQWRKFCYALTEEEIPFLFQTQGDPWTVNRSLAASVRAKAESILGPNHVAFAHVPASVPPAPRLVGIETNPGPSRGRRGGSAIIDLMTPGAAALGAAIASGRMVPTTFNDPRRSKNVFVPVSVTTKKKKKAQSRGARAAGNVLAMSLGTTFPRSGPRLTPSGPGVMVRGNVAPVHRVRVPFNGVTLPIYVDPTTVANPPEFGAPGGSHAMLLDPTINNNSFYVFGPSIAQLAGVYRRYRVNSLSLSYEPAVGTGTQAYVSLGCISEPGVNTSAGGLALSTITGINGAVVINAGQKANFGADWIRDWLFCENAATNNTPAERQQSAGAIVLSGSGIGQVAGSLLGFVRTSGVIEFEDLSSPYTLLTKSGSSASSSSPARLRVDETEEKENETEHGILQPPIAPRARVCDCDYEHLGDLKRPHPSSH